MKFKNDESGQILVFTLLSMTMLFGFMALAIDVGILFRAKRNVQIAADAAAIAGALESRYNGTTNVASVADAAALANGVASTYVTVNQTPADGYHTGSSFVEVDISQPTPTFFMGIINGGHSLNVGARAVAGSVPATACMYVLDPSDPDTLHLKGSDDLEASSCGIVVNSSDASAYCVTGSGNTVNAPYINVHGGQGGSSCGGVSKGTAPISTGALTQNDPLGNFLGPPTQPSCSTTSSATTVTTGFTAPGAGNAVCFTKAVTISGSLGAGTYVFENGVTIGGATTVTNGTLDIQSGTFNQANQALTITAPGPSAALPPAGYRGIAIMQPSTNTNELQLQFGSGTETLTGLVYAPGALVFMQDNGGSVDATGIIAYKIQANTTLKISSLSAVDPADSPLQTVKLVE